MSQWTIVELQMNDGDCICAALKDMGLEHEKHATAQELLGFGGSRVQNRKAHIIIRKQSLGNKSWGDCGFYKQADGTYQLVSDFRYSWTSQSGERDTFLQELKQLYGKHKVIKQAKKMGFRLNGTKVLEDGKIKIKVTC